jgi:hypothetical protein
MIVGASWLSWLRDGLIAVVLIGGAAGLGGSAADWLDRGKRTEVMKHQWKGVTASWSLTVAMRRSDVALAAERSWPARVLILD